MRFVHPRFHLLGVGYIHNFGVYFRAEGLELGLDFLKIIAAKIR
jgi:hypothetical protein